MATPAVPATVATEEVAPAAFTIPLDDSTREMFANCEPGEEHWVRILVETKDGVSLTATPLEVEYDEEAEAVPAEGDTPKAIAAIVGKGKTVA